MLAIIYFYYFLLFFLFKSEKLKKILIELNVMAIGKNKKLSKKGKGTKKKVIDPLSRKEWFDLRAPVPFKAASFGKTLVNKS